MAYEEDYIMRQVKAIGELGGNFLAYVLKLNQSNTDLGEIENEAGEKISGQDYLQSLIIEHKYHDAFIFVNALKLKLAFFEYECVATNFIQHLTALDDSIKEKYG